MSKVAAGAGVRRRKGVSARMKAGIRKAASLGEVVRQFQAMKKAGGTTTGLWVARVGPPDKGRGRA